MKKTTKGMKVTVLSIACTAFAALGFAFAKPTVASADMNPAISTFEVVGGAAIRKSAPEGIRFTARIDKDQREDGQTFGMIVMPTESFQGELTLTTPNVLDIPADQWVDEAAYADNEFDVEYDYYTAVVSDETGEFPEKYYNVLLSARGYVNDGTATYYTDTVSVRSIAYVAKMAQLAGEPDPNGTIAKIAPKAEIELSQDEFSLQIGGEDSLRLYIGNVAVKANDAAKISVEYSSDNERVVSVDQEGNVTANRSGSANVSVKLTVNNGTPMVKIATVTVARPEITSFDQSLVRPTYDSLFIENGVTSLTYEENITVGQKTLDKALHVHSDTTSYGGADAANNGHYFALPATIMQQATEAGYTNVRIEYYAMAGMRGYANRANTEALFNDTFGRTEYDSLSKTVSLAKFGSGENYLNFVMGYFHNYDKNVYDGTQATDIYITEMYFYGKTDYAGDFISLNDMETITKGGATTMTYEENVTVGAKTFAKAYHVRSETTTSGSSAASNAGHFITIPNAVVAAAQQAGYTSLKMTMYTVSGGKLCSWYGGTSWWSIDAHATEMREVSSTINLSSVGTNAMQLLFYHNESQFIGDVPTDIYITEMIFTGSVKGDLVTENSLYDFTKGAGVVMSYEENVTVNDKTFDRTIHVHIPTTVKGSANSMSVGTYFYLPNSVIANAISAGYTHLNMTIYTQSGGKFTVGHKDGTAVWFLGATETKMREVSTSIDLSNFGTNQMLALFNHDNIYGEGVASDVYITAYEFVTK